jgi:hypothetical protein
MSVGNGQYASCQSTLPRDVNWAQTVAQPVLFIRVVLYPYPYSYKILKRYVSLLIPQPSSPQSTPSHAFIIISAKDAVIHFT